MKKKKQFVIYLLTGGLIFLWGGMIYARVGTDPVLYCGVGIALWGMLHILAAALIYESDFNK